MAFSKSKRNEWLKHFSKNGNKSAACRATGVNVREVHKLEARNRFFRERVEDAKLDAVGRLEEEAHRRAVEGTPNYVVSDGRVVRYRGKPLIKREYSDSLLALLLRAHGGEAYKTKTDATHHFEVDGDEAARKLADALSRKFGPGEGTAGEGNK